MPTKGKGSFNPVGIHSQLLTLCGSQTAALSFFLAADAVMSMEDQIHPVNGRENQRFFNVFSG
jgi:hypothetical protein